MIYCELADKVVRDAEICDGCGEPVDENHRDLLAEADDYRGMMKYGA